MQRIDWVRAEGETVRSYFWHRGLVLIATAIAALSMPGTLSAQANGTSARASIQVTARVVQGITVRGVNPLNFGDIVAPANSTTKEVAKSDPSAGMFEVVGAAGQGVQVSFVAPTALTRTGGPGSLAIALSLYGAPTQGAAGGAQQVFPQGTITLANGRYYFFLAGTLTVRDVVTNPAGVYSGEFQLSVTQTTI
jgi:hypothetical protein